MDLYRAFLAIVLSFLILPGYQYFLAVMRDPSNPEYEDFCAWLGAKSFDSGLFDIKTANARLGQG